MTAINGHSIGLSEWTWIQQILVPAVLNDLISGRLYDRSWPLKRIRWRLFPGSRGGFSRGRRAEVIHSLFLDEIEQLRPEGKENPSPNRPEMAVPYPHFCKKRYHRRSGIPTRLPKSLYNWDRQFRRDHSRALQAGSVLRVWQRYFQAAGQPPGAETVDLFEDQASFELHAEQLDLNEVIQGVISLIARRLEIEAVPIGNLRSFFSPVQVFTDTYPAPGNLLSLLTH